LDGLQSDTSMNGIEVTVDRQCEKDPDRWFVIQTSRNNAKVRVHVKNLFPTSGSRGPKPPPASPARTRPQEGAGAGSGTSAAGGRGRGGSRGRGRSRAARATDEAAADAGSGTAGGRGRGGSRGSRAVRGTKEPAEVALEAGPEAANGRGRGGSRGGRSTTESADAAGPANGASVNGSRDGHPSEAPSPPKAAGMDLRSWMKKGSSPGQSGLAQVDVPTPAKGSASRGRSREDVRPAGNAQELLPPPPPLKKRRADAQPQPASADAEVPPDSKASASRSRSRGDAPTLGSSPSPKHRLSDSTQTPAPSPERPSPARVTGKTPARTIEEIYQKKTQLEHILLRPDSYVGSVEKQRQEMFVLSSKDGAADSDGPKMERRVLEIVPALYKIFDEILVNAADNLVRDETMDMIRVTIDAKGSQVSVRNNGRGVPVEMHGEHHCYVPELIFGQLLTSDNYDDNEKKVVGGRNGYGAKLTNIFSKQFVIETADSKRKKRYKQTWTGNMTKRGDPEITACENEDFTCVTFQPDLPRFGMSHLEPDIIALMERRAYDVAASTRGRCRVYLNEKELSIHSFEDYVGLFLSPDTFRICETYSDRWQVGIAVSDGSGSHQVSMVNSISTTRGGTHVDYIANQAISSIMERFSKQRDSKAAMLTVKKEHVRQYLWIFVNCLIENPAFDSQTKETLTTKKDRFGSTCTLSDKMLDAVVESGIVDALTSWSKAMSQSDLAKHLNKSDYGKQARLFGISKLEDANHAGTKNSEKCTLIITEGDSAKALAVAGLSVIGRDQYGVFPLRGKMRNVRDMTVKQMMENQEIEHLSRILALDPTREYEDVRSLRYGSLMIMADQDFDGSHIKGLVINFIHHWFPGLLKQPGFLKEFVTPIVKATKDDDTKVFFTIPEYEAWKEEMDGARDWKCKYYKGLGTSTSSEAREYFSDLDQHELRFEHSVHEEDHDLIDMAFNRARADDRKKWISECEEGTFVDHSQSTLTYSDFVNKELVLWAQYDVLRMIPSIVDGFKPGQRKVLHACFRKKLTSDMKVAQLSGYVAEHTAYHHGEASLQGTIIGMAQNFVGSNNINLLVPSGQFGTRIQGGKDHAASRYIFTRLSPVTRCIFPEADDAVLEYLSEEGLSIEPKWYCPIIPMALVNGAEGIGVGWATSIPNYNPREIIQNIRHHLRGEPLQAMHPWYRGFKGTLTPIAGDVGKYENTGVVNVRGRSRVEITELPIGRWTQDYKEWTLEQLPKKDADTRSLITEFREYHTETSVHFSLTVPPDKLANAESKGLHKQFHCYGRLSSTNMMLFGADGKLKKFETPEDILIEFAKTRLEVYGKRKEHHIAKLAREAAVLNDKARFVLLVVQEVLIVENRPAADLCKDMRQLGLRTKSEIEQGDVSIFEVSEEMPKKKRVRTADDSDKVAADMGPEGYGYLVKMKLWTLTAEKVAELENQLRKKLQVLEELRKTTLEELWERDLVKLEASLDAKDKEDSKEEAEANKLSRKKNPEAEEAMINNQCVLVLCKNSSEIKRVKTVQWRAQKRGGAKGASVLSRAKTKNLEDGAEAEDGEAAEDPEIGSVNGIFPCHDFDALLAFTSDGHVYAMQALDVPLKKKHETGASITTLLPAIEKNGHSIRSVITVPQGNLQSVEDEFIVLVTADGCAKKIPLKSFRNVHIIRQGKPNSAIALEDDDNLLAVLRATDKDVLVAASERGLVLCVKVKDLKLDKSLKTRGKIAMRFRPDDRMACCDIAVDAAPPPAVAAPAPAASSDAPAAPVAEVPAQPSEAAAFSAPVALPATKVAKTGGRQRRRGARADDDDSGNSDAEMTSAPEAQAAPPAPALVPDSSIDSSVRAAADQDESDAESAHQDDEEASAEESAAISLDAVIAARAAAEAADDDMEDDKEEASENEEPEGTKTTTQPLPGKDGGLTSTLSMLIITSSGNGKRVLLKDLGIQRRGRQGRKAIKVEDSQKVAALCIVPGDQIVKPPRRPAEPWELFKEKHIQNIRGKFENEELLQKLNEANELNFVELFSQASEADRTPYNEQHANDQKVYEAAVEVRKQQMQSAALSQHGQVIVCTHKGLVKRLMSITVGVMKRGSNKGNPIMKLDRNDFVISAAVVSAVDNERDDVAAEQDDAEDAGASGTPEPETSMDAGVAPADEQGAPSPAPSPAKKSPAPAPAASPALAAASAQKRGRPRKSTH